MAIAAPGAMRGVGVALHLAQCQRRLGDTAVAVADPVVRVLPPLIGQARDPKSCWYSMYPSPSLSPYSAIHSSARSAFGTSLRKASSLETPPAELAEQHDEQRRRVDRAVVRVATGECWCVDAEVSGLVHDAAGLFLR